GLARHRQTDNRSFHISFQLSAISFFGAGSWLSADWRQIFLWLQFSFRIPASAIRHQLFGRLLKGDSSQWYFYLAEKFFDYALAGLGAALHQSGARVDHYTMREQRRGETFDVIRNGEVAAFNHRQRLHRAIQRLAAARAHPERQ